MAAYNWSGGIEPPPSLWLAAPNDARIVRDAKGNALVRFVGGLPVNTTAYRLPEVAVGENQYIPFEASYTDGTFLGFFRMLAGGHVDLSDSFTDHAQYVRDITYHARGLEALGYSRRRVEEHPEHARNRCPLSARRNFSDQSRTLVAPA